MSDAGSSRAPAAIDPADYRRTLGSFTTGVTVITAMHRGAPVGMAANSFTSVSLDPPLVAFCAGKSSTTWPQIEESGRFCVNVLAADQRDLCLTFAKKGADRFDGVDWRPGISGSPILAGSLAWIDCETQAIHDAGDHLIVIGRVLALDDSAGREPLVFFRGAYGTFAP